MNFIYRTSNAFFVSSAGRRLQEQIKYSFGSKNLRDHPAVLIGPVFPFLALFNQNNPDFISEKETLTENDLLSFRLPARNISFIFIAALNNSVAENLPVLIKEASRALKQRGELIVLIKNKRKPNFLDIREIPELPLSSLDPILTENGFSVQKKKGLLYFPFAFKVFKIADDFLFRRITVGGHFSILAAQKNPLVLSNAENYNSARMTNASVLTSPRT